jgi:hypothetical protein
MQAKSIPFVTLVAAGLGAGIGCLLRAQPPSRQPSGSRPAPATVTYVFQLIDDQGIVRLRQKKLVAQRASGSRVHILQTFGYPNIEGPFETRDIFDVERARIVT